MPLLSPLLRLPRELRELIYECITHDPNGYHYDHKLGKLRASSGPVELNLMYTCRTIAREMSGLALRINTVVFSTVYSKHERQKAALFDNWNNAVYRKQCHAFHLTGNPDLQLFMTSEILSELRTKYPQFMDASYLSGEWSCDRAFVCAYHRDGSDSEHRAFLDLAFELLSRNPAFTDAVSRRNLRYISVGRLPIQLESELVAFKDMNLDPWTIPLAEEFVSMSVDEDLEIYHWNIGYFDHSHHRILRRVKFRFSAAAIAIQYLKSLPSSTRLQIRKILLNEDYQSVAHAQCHALGLVPFCLENSSLRIERRLSLWRTVLPAAHESLIDMVSTIQHAQLPRRSLGRARYLKYHTITQAFSTWIREVSALFAAGMPLHSFSLVFDGEPTPDRSSEIFEIAQRDAAYQTAFYQFCCQNSIHLCWQLTCRREGCFSRSLPQLLTDIVEEKSRISCNFPVSTTRWDGDLLFEGAQHLNVVEWMNKRIDGVHENLQTSPPLPPWIDLRLEQIIPGDTYQLEQEELRDGNSLSYFNDFIELLGGERDEKLP